MSRLILGFVELFTEGYSNCIILNNEAFRANALTLTVLVSCNVVRNKDCGLGLNMT